MSDDPTMDPTVDAAVDAWLADPTDAGLDAIEAAVAEHPGLDGDRAGRRAALLARAHRPPSPAPAAPAAPAAPRPNRRWILAGGAAALAAAAAALLLVRTPTGPTLVHAEEAALPELTRVTRGDDTGGGRGPILRLDAPTDGALHTHGFPLRVRWTRRDGQARVEPDSFRMVYLRGGGIDVTSRLGASPGPGGIDVPLLRTPSGHHTFEITLLDAEGEATRRVFEVRVR